MIDNRLVECAQAAAWELVGQAFAGRWEAVPSGQPEWLLVQALATAATGSARDGEALARLMVAGRHARRLADVLGPALGFT